MADPPEGEDEMTAYETIIVERPEPRIARIVMNRPEARNAQNLQMTYDLNAVRSCGTG
jgi:enoyl-CoA hydratase